MYNITSQSHHIFGTDGIRGKPGLYPLTDGMLFKIGRSLAHLIRHNDRRKKNYRVIIGKDTRLSGQRIELLLSDALNSYGIEVLLCGTVPTPGISHLVQKLDADMGIMISASHNKASDNGIKLITCGGRKITLEDEESLEHIIVSSFMQKPADSKHLTKAKTVLYEGGVESYLDYLSNCFKDMNLSGYKVMVDCSFGAASGLATELFQRLGAKVKSIHDLANGQNINVGGVSDISYLQKEMVRDRADIGFALDGDADRLMLVDERGGILDGDYIMAIIGLWLLKHKRLQGRTLVTTIASNQGLIDVIEAAGGRVIRTDIGERFVLQALLKNKLNFGGEQAGQIIYLDYAASADALLAALMVLKIMKETMQPLSLLAGQMKKIPQILVNVAIKEKKPFHAMDTVWNAIMQSQKKLSDQGRLVVRYSGTEDLARIMVEGKDKVLIEDIAYHLADIFKKEIGLTTASTV